MPTITRTHIFISYSHEDREWLEQLERMLRPLVRTQTIEVWSDERISPGEQWKSEIELALTRARMAVLLVSPDFLASDHIHRYEMPRLLEAAARDELTILWVPVRACLWEETQIAGFQAAHDPSRPLGTLPKGEREVALKAICECIRKTASGATRDYSAEGVLARNRPPRLPQALRWLGGWWLLVAGATGTLGAGLWGMVTDWGQPWSVLPDGDTLGTLNRPFPPTEMFVLQDEQGREIGLARHISGFLRPIVEIDVPDPSLRQPKEGERSLSHIKARPLEPHEPVPEQVLSAGRARLLSGARIELNLGSEHGLKPRMVFAGELGELAVVRTVKRHTAVLEACAGNWTGETRVTRRLHLQLELSNFERKVRDALRESFVERLGAGETFGSNKDYRPEITLSEGKSGDVQRTEQVLYSITCIDPTWPGLNDLRREVETARAKLSARARFDSRRTGISQPQAHPADSGLGPEIVIGSGNVITAGPGSNVQNGILIGESKEKP